MGIRGSVVKRFSELKQTKSIQALRAQPRLQWLLLIIFVIILLSITKACLDNLTEYRSSMITETNLYERLKRVSRTEFSVEELTNAEEQSTKLRSLIPVASSQNAAQASALTEIERELGALAERERYSLLGSEAFQIGNRQFWSIRIEIVGQLKPSQTINFLEVFDPSVLHRRVSSMRYSPKAANSINLVVDLLYQLDEES